jgi:peptidoglycan/LPS O-acetylase OafA/YrhL
MEAWSPGFTRPKLRSAFHTPMMRLLQILLLLALAWVVWRLIRNRLAPPAERDQTRPPEFEPMARCAACGVHVPKIQLDTSGRCPRCHNA